MGVLGLQARRILQPLTDAVQRAYGGSSPKYPSDAEPL